MEGTGKDKRKRIRLIILIPLLAILGITIFMLTQNMRLTMVLADWWTIAHAVLSLSALLCYIFAYKKDKSQTNGRKPHHAPA